MKSFLNGLGSLALMFALMIVWFLATTEIKPAMPVQVVTRDGLVGKVVSITARKEEGFIWAAHVRHTDWAGNFKNSGDISMVNGWATEIGWLEGYSIASGDRVVITSYGYRPRVVWVW